ncbi:Fe(3+) ions import ATP-binding protein FbpC [uncultured Sporomusa sp.]|uniref:Fe(3+) ions import ATP-binding protein FbpC n=1 Tax=uncultured Sporomusa sp. TaxID=307249 RepID=A0A212LMB7_9FIRM|nr:ABC transporter ATP-binding protein [uncultured Sporomusa sp.]SCM78675.1 Fe(3+) ions import ATP-binding protein FbpC [uncultured Sporomusa sp.]
MSVSIDIENVVKKYGNDTIIKGLSLQIAPGEFFTLLGPSGCGKTTLLRMIIGFNSIEGGLIKVGGRIVNDISPDKRNMGMVFQNYAIFPHMSVKDNVAFGLKMRRIPEKDIEQQVDGILKIVKIDHLKDRMPAQLSGGQQQRVALARAIVIHPEVLLMDEPLSNLDAKLRVEMRNAIKSIQRQINTTTVYVTHDQEEALAISDRIAVMHNGIIQQIDSPRNIYQRPANTFVSSFIGLSNILEARLVRHGDGGTFVDFANGYRVSMDNIDETAADGQAVLVSVRPEEFQLNTTGEGLPALVKSSVFLGLNTHYFVTLQNGQEFEVIQDGQETIADGTPVYLAVKPHKINVFHHESKNTLIKGESK